MIFDSGLERSRTLASVFATAAVGLGVLAIYYALSASIVANPIPYIWGTSAIVIVPIVVAFYLVGRRLLTKSRELDKKLRA